MSCVMHLTKETCDYQPNIGCQWQDNYNELMKTELSIDGQRQMSKRKN